MLLPRYEENSETLPNYVASNEPLPLYAPSVEYLGLVMVLIEQESPYDHSTRPKWAPLLLELNSTQLNVFYLNDVRQELEVYQHFNELTLSRLETCLDIKKTPHFNDSKGQRSLPIWGKQRVKPGNKSEIDNADFDQLINTFPHLDPATLTSPQTQTTTKQLRAAKGFLSKSYTLQRAAIGSACDVKDKNFVLRARLETQQILIQTPNFKEFFNWYWRISIGSDLSLAIEERTCGAKTIPKTSYLNSSRIYEPTFHEGANIINSFKNKQLEDQMLLATISHDSSVSVETSNFLQLIYISRCITSLENRDPWVGKPVIVYDSLPKIDGYVYDVKTTTLLPKTKRQMRNKMIDVRLVRQLHLTKYIRDYNQGRISKFRGEEYLISKNGLVHLVR